MSTLYNIWLTIEPVEVDDDTGEVLDWPHLGEEDCGKLYGPLGPSEATAIANRILEEEGSSYRVTLLPNEETLPTNNLRAK